jgi:hypothetical protein
MFHDDMFLKQIQETASCEYVAIDEGMKALLR